MAQFYAQDSRLQLVQTAVPTSLRAEVAAGLPVVAESAQPRGKLFVIGHDHSRIAVRAQILARVETQAARASHRARLAPVIARSHGLRIVFDQGDAVLCCERKNGIHVRGETE